MRNYMKNNKGITIIPLIITIALMLIIGGIGISLSLGNNGILNKSANAVDIYKQAEKEEEEHYDERYLQMLSAGDDVKEIKNDNGIKVATKVYDGNDKFFVLPEGFYYVGGTVDSGVVISDNSIDENKYKGKSDVGKDLQGNQYVWVPVDGVNLKYQKHEYETKQVNDGPVTIDTGNGNWSTQAYRVYTDWIDTGINIKSVEKYGGFYVARYEAGYKEVQAGDIYETDTTKNNSSNVPLSKAGLACWNCISQANAKLVSKNLNYLSVNSSLIDSYAWDTIMDWYILSGIDINSSSSYGNYMDNRSVIQKKTIYTNNVYRGVKSGKTGTNGVLYAKEYKEAETSFIVGYESITTLEELQKYTNATEIDIDNYYYIKYLELITGASEDYKINNIYDMGGNMWEWSAEESTYRGTLRGGACTTNGSTGSFSPINMRHGGNSVGGISFNFAFRVVLYIK